MSDRTRGFLLVLLASVLLSTLATAVKLGLGSAGAAQLLAPRMVLAMVLLWAWIGITRPQRLRIDRRGLLSCAVGGALNTISMWLFYLSLTRIDASVEMLIFSVYPALLLFMLHLSGEKVSQLDLVRLTLAIVGIALVANPTGDVDLVGVALALACAGTYAAYMLLIHARLLPYAASTTTVWMTTFMAIGSLLLRLGYRPAQPLDTAGWAVVLWSAVVGTVIARMMIIAGIRLVGGGQTALLLPVQTILSIVWSMLLLGERLSGLQTIGAALVVASVALAAQRRAVTGTAARAATA